MSETNSIVTKISLWTFAIAVFFLPLKTTISNFGLILFLVMSTISIIINGYERRLLRTKTFYLLTTFGFFCIMLIGLLYTPDRKEGVELIGRLVFYGLMPFALLRRDLDKKQLLNYTFYALLTGGVLSMLYLHFNNMYSFYTVEEPHTIRKLFAYNHTSLMFVAPLKDMHPVYLGAYYLMLAMMLFSKDFRQKMIYKIFFILLIGITVIFLNSRIIILLLLLLLSFKLFKYYRHYKKYAIIGVSLLVAVFFILKDTYVFVKLINGSTWELTQNIQAHGIDSKKKGDSRMARWVVAIDLIAEKPIFGHGTGIEREMLTKAYHEKGMEISQENRFNSHNQYLGFAIDFGLLGLTFLCIFLFGNIIRNIKNKNEIGLFFFIVIGACCLTENFLIRNMGVNFVAIFTLLFFNIDNIMCPSLKRGRSLKKIKY